MSQLKTIILLVETGGLTGRDLAERLGIGPSAVTALVDRLVQRGYARREEDRADRRVSWARPTEKAIELFERLHATHRERLAEVLATLAPEELARVAARDHYPGAGCDAAGRRHTTDRDGLLTMPVDDREPTAADAVRPMPTSIAGILAALSAVILGAFMAILDATIVNVALPTFGRVFESSLQSLQWIITGYMLASAAVIPLSGWLSDRFGAKRVYLVALVLFTAGSALCAVATTASTLTVFRVLQGLGGGMLMPVGMAILYRLAPPDKRGAVMGIFGIPMLLGPALGPVISGWLLEYASWPWIFLINVPVGAAAVVIGLRSLPTLPAEHSESRLDTLGMVFGPLAFASLTYGISESTEAGWTGRSTVTGITVGLAALAAFIARELTTTQPLLELRVFKSRDFSLAIMTQWLMIAGMFGTFFLIPVFLQQVRGYSPFQTGLITLPNALVAAMTMPIAGRLFDKVGARPPVFVGMLIVISAFWMLSGISADDDGLGSDGAAGGDGRRHGPGDDAARDARVEQRPRSTW